MLQRQSMAIFLIFCMVAACLTEGVSAHPVDITIGRQYFGQYISNHPGNAFGYLEHPRGDILATFYASNNRDSVNSMNLLLLDPRYEDKRATLLTLRGIVQVDERTGRWQLSNHTATLSKAWRKREVEMVSIASVNTTVLFQNLDSEDYEEVTVTVQMSGEGFDFTAQLKFYNQIVPTMLYSLYVSAVVLVQIFSAYMLMRDMDGPNFAAIGCRYSLLTLAACNILDFAQMMTHVQLIMGSSGGYLFFVLPMLSYLCLFVCLEMKMLFLAWKSHNLEVLDQQQDLRKRITSFYFRFYLGLFAYLTLNYFFAFEPWMVLLRNLVLLPQILHNTQQGQKPIFNPYYVFGFIGSRLLIPVYEYSCPENRFKLAPNNTLVFILVTVFACETLLLVLQGRIGPRFFVPKRLRPNYFDYSYKMNAKEHGEDCAICLQGLIDNPSTTATSASAEPSLNQEILVKEECLEAMVMKTPCNHKFHEECLIQWVQVKLECPTCRSTLPPL